MVMKIMDLITLLNKFTSPYKIFTGGLEIKRGQPKRTTKALQKL